MSTFPYTPEAFVSLLHRRGHRAPFPWKSSYDPSVVKVFGVVCILAAASSGVGLWGVRSHQNRDVEAALAALPGDHVGAGPDGSGDSAGLALETLFGVSDGPLGSTSDAQRERMARAHHRAARRLERLGALDQAYRTFRQRRFSPAVDGVLKGPCDEGVLPNPDRCVTHARQGLLKLRTARDEARWIYEAVLLGSRVLWGIAGVLALLWVYRAYAQIRRQARRAPETPS